MDELLGKRLAEFRKRKNLSQEELANKLNVSRQSIINWENDEVKPSIDYLKDLASLYGVTIDDLINTNKKIEDCFKKEEAKEKHINISKNGIFINDNESNEKLSISEDGIFINGNHVGSSIDKVSNEKRKIKMYEKIGGLVDGILVILSISIYSILGFIDSNYRGLLWPMLFLSFIPGGLIRSIGTKNASKFPIVFIALSIYFFMGTLFPYYLNISGWHPYWVILFIIPAYYILINSIKSIIKIAKKDKDISIIEINNEDDED